jgi:UDP-glucose 4-epimerase
MKALVTGGCGFIGSHLTDALIAAKHDVFVIDDLSTGKEENLNSCAKLIKGSILTPGIFDALLKEVDVCFHLAAIPSVERSRTDWLATHAVNAGGTVALFDALARCGRKIPVVFASSAAVYGNAGQMPLSEDMIVQPATAYGTDKLACEHNGFVAASIHGIPNIGLRFFNVYGPRQNPSSPYSGVISIFHDRIAQGEPITIYGNGKQCRDFIYVGDVVEALLKAMESISHKQIRHDIFNICTGKPATVSDLARTIGMALSRNPDIVYTESRRGDIRASIGNPEKAANKLSFHARTDLAEGLNLIC